MDHFDQIAEAIPFALLQQNQPLWGAKGIALVDVFQNDLTSPGWGKDSFVANYLDGVFSMEGRVRRFRRDDHPFAFVMRASRLICIDIDGKNGGFDGVKSLGWLPLTLAETSKSGNGYHLFYEVVDVWDPLYGFNRFSDVIGLAQGVDIRATGCVYHYKQQRWNNRRVAYLPMHIVSILETRKAARLARVANIKKTLLLEEDEILMMHTELLEELEQPVPAGRRNNTLFAIGVKLNEAQVPGWGEKLRARGEALGLDEDELDRLVRNITKYG